MSFKVFSKPNDFMIYILPGREATPETLESPKPELLPSPVDKNHLRLLSCCHKLPNYN